MLFTKCDPCMIWEMSHSNPKVLFTFQFGSRIVSVLRKQDLRKSPASIATQPPYHFPPSLLLPGSLCSHWLSGCCKMLGITASFLSFGLWGCGRVWICQSCRALGCKRITCEPYFHTEDKLTLHVCLLQAFFLYPYIGFLTTCLPKLTIDTATFCSSYCNKL